MATAEATMNTAEIIEMFQRYVMPNYGAFRWRWSAAKARTSGTPRATAISTSFPAGAATCWAIVPPPVVEAVQRAGRPADPRAQHLVHRSPGPLGQGAFASGASAARRSSATRAPRPTRRRSSWPGCTRPSERYKIITFEGGFHGRTLGSTSATAQPKYHEGLGPLMAGFVYAPFGDLDAVARLIDDETAAIMIEPIQGEGGVHIPPDGFLAGLAANWPTSTSCC